MVNVFALIAAVSMSLFAFSNSAEAQQVSCRGLSTEACEAAKKNLNRAPYQGPVRPANEPMACARVVSYHSVSVEWVDRGGVSKSNWYRGRLITSTGIAHTETFPLNERWVVTESCIPRRLLNNVSELTLCTGLYADGFHWNLTSSELSSMKRSGHFTSYVPFLQDRDRNRLSRGQVTAAYQVRYR